MDAVSTNPAFCITTTRSANSGGDGEGQMVVMRIVRYHSRVSP